MDPLIVPFELASECIASTLLFSLLLLSDHDISDDWDCIDGVSEPFRLNSAAVSSILTDSVKSFPTVHSSVADPWTSIFPYKKKFQHTFNNFARKIVEGILASFKTIIQSAALRKCTWCVTNIRVAPLCASRLFGPMHFSNICAPTCVSTALKGSSNK